MQTTDTFIILCLFASNILIVFNGALALAQFSYHHHHVYQIQSFSNHFFMKLSFTCTYIEQCGGMVEGDCTVPLIYVLSYGYVDNHLIACIP